MHTLTVATLLLVSAIAANAVYTGPPHLKVLTVLHPPYVSQGSGGKLTGVIIEIFDLLAASLGFTYDIALQPDGLYGAPQADKTWNGLVRSLIDGKCDVAAADLTITKARDEVIDFCTPFSQFNVRILTSVATGLTNVKYFVLKDTSTEQFLKLSANPLDQEIWKNIQDFNGFVSSQEAGINQVLKGGAAYVDDQSVLAAAIAANPGKLKMEDRVLINAFNAFGTPQDSPLRDQLGIGMSGQNEQGKIRTILTKYNLIA